MRDALQSVPASRTPPFRLSKSRFLAGLQCEKRLYLDIHAPELATSPDTATQAMLDMGIEVGSLARRRVPGGVLVTADHRHSAEALRETAALLHDLTVPAIYEGAFEYDDILVRVDILERVTADDGIASWRLIEVKASTKVKDVHLEDLAVQAYVLRGAGVPLSGVSLMHINTRYVHDGGEWDLQQLFSVEDVTEAVAARATAVQPRVASLRTTLRQAEAPSVEPDWHCHTPYECPYWEFCTKDKPDRWIFHLPGGGRTFSALTKRGIQIIDDIPQDVPLSSAQQRMRMNVEWLSGELCTRLTAVRYPVHHVDFETFMPAIPLFPATRPYQTIPMQWSNHIQEEDGAVRHEAYLCSEARDPREEFVVALLESLGREGTVCVYSPYERAVLERLAETFPPLRGELKRVLARLWDLHAVVKDHYYHPAFQGSYSIKSVLPALAPSMTYEDLEIQDGAMAARYYYRMIFQETDWVKRIEMREALLSYCARDSEALVEVRRALLRKVTAAALNA